ncbi:MAG: DNA/RNA non-specific endonuclease [Bacteroidales bacterium]|nr:DNA/RNA non-specific endonuclease [Bacteroidales bacterium]
MTFHAAYRTLKAVAAFAVAAVAVLACGESKDNDGQFADLSVPYTTVEASGAKSMKVSVQASGAWTLDLQYKGAAEDWAGISGTSGKGSSRSITFSAAENTSSSQRSCLLLLTCGNNEASVEIVQRPKNSYNLEGEAQPRWMELPVMTDGSNYFFHHDMKVGSKETRNFSFYLNPSAKISEWVAYPLNRGLIGQNSGRSNTWDVDPKVPEAYQPIIYSPFKGGYERGHQIPSADRYADGANEATYYGTNMTPQNGTLNGEAWATLEGYVRDWSYVMDTLYVVTGADLNGSTKYATDNAGKKISVPAGYYKALLGYKKSKNVGITGVTGGYTAVGFYFRNSAAYDDDIPAAAMTIDELEKKLGMDFFPLLATPAAAGKGGVGPRLSAKVESTMDQWWLNYLKIN